jgi:hypothetical protein
MKFFRVIILAFFYSPILAGSTSVKVSRIPAKIDSQQVILSGQGVTSVDTEITHNDSNRINIIIKIFTDPSWLQAIVAIITMLTPGIFFIIKRLIKNKSPKKLLETNEPQLNLQEEQIKELKKQNEIIMSQLEISKDLHLMEKIKLEKANKERMKEIRPFFICSGSNRKGEEITLTMKNQGYTATKINISNSNCENIVFHHTNKIMDKIVNNFTYFINRTTSR